MSQTKENILKAADKIKSLIDLGFQKLAADAPVMPADQGECVEDNSKIEIELQDGSKAICYGDVAQGSKISTVQADGTELPAPDGELIAKDGSVITVKGGIIESVTAATASQGEEAFNAQESYLTLSERVSKLEELLTQSQSQNQELRSDLAKTKDDLGKTKESLAAAFSALEIISGAPASKPVEEKFNAIKKEDKVAELASFLKKLQSKNK